MRLQAQRQSRNTICRAQKTIQIEPRCRPVPLPFYATTSKQKNRAEILCPEMHRDRILPSTPSPLLLLPLPLPSSMQPCLQQQPLWSAGCPQHSAATGRPRLQLIRILDSNSFIHQPVFFLAQTQVCPHPANSRTVSVGGDEVVDLQWGMCARSLLRIIAIRGASTPCTMFIISGTASPNQGTISVHQPAILHEYFYFLVTMHQNSAQKYIICQVYICRENGIITSNIQK